MRIQTQAMRYYNNTSYAIFLNFKQDLRASVAELPHEVKGH